MPQNEIIFMHRTQTNPETRPPVTEGRYCRARAFRDGKLICGRVELIVTADLRLGLAPHERRYFAAQFLERLHPSLCAELADLVRHRGVVARRAAERMQPIEIVFDDLRLGSQAITARIQPPQQRHGELYGIKFALRELAP
jgi:hypothetical protein